MLLLFALTLLRLSTFVHKFHVHVSVLLLLVFSSPPKYRDHCTNKSLKLHQNETGMNHIYICIYATVYVFGSMDTKIKNTFYYYCAYSF